MKNFMKSLSCLFIAAVMGLTSCIKNEVAPEVDALRKAQVDKMLAEITSLNLENRAEKLDIYFDSLFLAIDLERDKADLEWALMNYDNRMLMEEVKQKENELALATQVAAYERFINQGQFSQNVVDLLGKYNNESHVLQQLYSDRITLNGQIAERQMMLITDQYDVWKARWEDRIADLTVKLNAQKDALVILEGVLANPATIQAKKADVIEELGVLADSLATMNAEYDIVYKEYATAVAKRDRAQDVIDLMEDNDPIGSAGYLNTLVDLNADLVDYNVTLAAQNQTLTNANATLATAQASLTTAQSAYNTRLTTWNTAKAAKDAATADVAAKQLLVNIAQTNYDNDPDATHPVTGPALTAAQDALTAANTALTTATTTYNAANTALTDAQADVSTAQTAFNTAKTNATNAQTAVNTTKASIALIQQDIENTQAQITKYQAEYDAAKANIAALNGDVSIIYIEYDEIDDLIGRLNDEIDELDDVYDALDDQLEDLQDVIVSQKLEIGQTENQIANIQDDIDEEILDKAQVEGEIANLQKLLATTEQKIVNSEAIVAVWKKLLDEAIAAQE